MTKVTIADQSGHSALSPRLLKHRIAIASSTHRLWACKSFSSFTTQKTTDLFCLVMESFSISCQSRPISRSDDVSLSSLLSSCHQPPTAPRCPPHQSPIPTHLHFPPPPLNLSITVTHRSTSLVINTAHTQACTRISLIQTHTQKSCSLSLAVILPLSYTQNAHHCLSLSMLWNALTRFEMSGLIHHCGPRLGCVMSPPL